MSVPWGPSLGQQPLSTHYAPPPNTGAYIPVPARQSFTPLQQPSYSAVSSSSQDHGNHHNSHFGKRGYPIAPDTYAQEPPPVFQPPPQQKPKIVWPQPVRDYVQRSFDPDHHIQGIAKEEIEIKLKQIISAAADDDRLKNVDWAHMELPQDMIQRERSQSSFASNMLQSPVNHNTTNWGKSRTSPSTLQKRKSLEEHEVRNDGDFYQPKPASGLPLSDRFTFNGAQPRFGDNKRQKREKEEWNSKKASKLESLSLENRQRRFDSFLPSTRPVSPPQTLGPVIGKSQTLEKNYYRLTAAPNPEDVRPLDILRQTLELLKKKWKKDRNYAYINDQFKSMRQDLTVQHIKNEFTVTVYEIHSRIALEKGDLGEFNQCQTQLHGLFAQNIAGHREEFKAYRMLYFIHTCNRSGMNDLLADLTHTDKAHRFIKHALEVRSSLALGNYHRFFQLYLETPNMGAYLMDMFIVRERLAAMANMSRAYKPQVKVRFITEELGFESDAQTIEFLYEYADESFVEEKDNDFYFLIAKASREFEAAKQAAFRTVDIKGQI